MTTPQLLVLLLVVVVAVALVWLLVRRSSARKDEARAEAAGLRAEAEAVAAGLPGQEAFAQQAEERAEVARSEADRLAEEAAGHRETVEVARADYAAMLGRADEVDPDVAAPASGDERRPMTRAEARQMREEAERAAWAGSPAAPVPGAAGAAVMGRDTGGVVRGPAVEEPVVDEPRVEESVFEEPVAEERVVEEPGADESTPVEDLRTAEPDADRPADDADGSEAGSEERSARIAAATDFRDGDDDAEEEYVWPRASAGTEADMDQNAADDRRTAATEAQAPPGEWGGPHADDATDEPVAQPTDEPDADRSDEPVEGSEVSEDPGAGAFTEPEEPAASDDEFDPTPERDWSADEGELLAENADRADELAAEREEMDREAAAAGMEPVHPESAEPVVEEDQQSAAADEQPAEVEQPVVADDAHAVEEDQQSAATDDEQSAAADEQPAGRAARRVSEFDEIRDGGYGMGSAAALEDGAQPLDHPVQGYRDTMTYRLPGDPGYDDAEAHVWFYDAAAAERSGFRRSDG